MNFFVEIENTWILSLFIINISAIIITSLFLFLVIVKSLKDRDKAPKYPIDFYKKMILKVNNGTQ